VTIKRYLAGVGAAAILPLFAIGGIGLTSAGATPSPSYSQGFETNTAGWCDLAGNPCDGSVFGPITRVPSGYSTGPNGYASGVASSSGAYHARISGAANNASPGGCVFYGSGSVASAPCTGPYSDFGLGTTDDTFPEPGFVTQVDIYLDTAYATNNPPPVVAGQQNIGDYRFDVETAINASNAFYLQGFDFNVGTGGGATGAPAGTFVIQASTNASRSGAYPENPCSPVSTVCVAPYVVTASGWYTFRWTFQDISGTLVPKMQLLNHAGIQLASWTATNDEHPISSVGGPTLLWFPNEEISNLALTMRA
jgi:hypothetical protein